MRPSAKTAPHAPLFLSSYDDDDDDAEFDRLLRNEVVEPEIEEPPSRRKRKPNITTLIKRARKAGERGPVRVELVNDDGSRIIVTSSSEAAPDEMTESEAEKLWHERIGKDAPH
jgi:hypothetical protein